MLVSCIKKVLLASLPTLVWTSLPSGLDRSVVLLLG